MCGIAGDYRFFSGSADKDLVRRMSEILRHRGPDGGSIYTSGRISLAHRRLAIIDLSDAGIQPMPNENGTLWIVYNGEIFNYIELRAELIQCGHRFSTETDTEVILHAYEEWGADCLSRFNGMWAFAIYNTHDESLFCARDRFGIKPFYYSPINGGILFGSEIKALLLHPEVGRKPDDEMVRTFLAWGIHDHTERTMFERVFQIPPGHFIIFSPQGEGETIRYFELTMNTETHSTPDIEGAAPKALLALLEDAVRLRLRSDVPVGTCLSGGIDSSTVTALINRLIKRESPESIGERQKTFSACFDDPASDESRYMNIILDATGASNERIFPDGACLKEDLARLLYMMDEPFGSLTCYSQYRVMQAASSQVKVVLDGQGADEELAGYIGYLPSLGKELWASGKPLAAFTAWFHTLRRHLPFFLDARSQLAVRRRRRACIRGGFPVIDRYRGPLSAILRREISETNLPALLHYEDRNASAFSIEARVPFLDYRLVEYIASLPLDQKVRNGETKHVLRQAISDIVPVEIAHRRDKMGFSTPEAIWMKEVLADQILALFASDRFRSRPYWDADCVLREFEAFLYGKAPYSTDLWRFACVERWLVMFFDNRPPA